MRIMRYPFLGEINNKKKFPRLNMIFPYAILKKIKTLIISYYLLHVKRRISMIRAEIFRKKKEIGKVRLV